MEDAPTLAESLRKAAPRIASHMNEDHSASLRAFMVPRPLKYGGLPDGEYVTGHIRKAHNTHTLLDGPTSSCCCPTRVKLFIAGRRACSFCFQRTIGLRG